ncbi:TPA: hypothetical protein DCW61_02475 [Candidatus Uhrbacteria bacterium]|nr:hypothetical protein [Candidatus Uhrbacteria bacterium]
MKKKSFLIVDKDAHYAQIYAQRFEASGWKVFVEEQFEQAKKKLERIHPDVIIVDLHPVQEALHFLTFLRTHSETKHILQIALSSEGGRKIMKQAQETGVDHYILKTHFLPSDAVKKVKRLLDENPHSL